MKNKHFISILVAFLSTLALSACSLIKGTKTTTNAATTTTNATTAPIGEVTTTEDEIPQVKIDPIITFAGEKNYANDGEAHSPQVTVTAGVEYTVEYHVNEVYFSSEAPSAPNTYAMVVTTIEDDFYNSITKFFVFTIGACDVTFSSDVAFEYDGQPHTPTYTLPEGVKVKSAYYAQNEEWYSDDAPTEVGAYALVVVTEANDQYCETTRWVVFRINAHKEKAIITFSIESGAKITEGEAIPTVKVEGVEGKPAPQYKAYFNCEAAGLSELEEPIANNLTWALVVKVTEDDTYAAESQWRTFTYNAKVDENKKVAEITIEAFDNGARFNAENLPTVTVTEGAKYTVSYSCGDAGIENAEMPIVNGKGWRIVVTVEEDDEFNAQVYRTNWFYFIDSTSKPEANVSFSNNGTDKGTAFDINNIPTVTVSDGAEYTITYSCEDAGIKNADHVSFTSKGWIIVVTVIENEKYCGGTYTSTWFRAVYNPTVTFSNTESGMTLNVAPTYTISPTPEEIGNGCTGYAVTVTFDCEEAGIAGAAAPEANGKGWIMTVSIAYDRHYNLEATATSKWFYYEIPTSKIDPSVTITEFDAGSKFNKKTLPTVTVTEGLTYTITYDCEEAGISGAAAPEANGKGWTMTVTVAGNDLYNDATVTSKWFYYEALTEKENAVVTFSNGDTAGLPFDLNNLPTATVSEGAEYTITYNCEEAGIFGASAVSFTGKGWSMTVTVKENDQYNAGTFTSKWFRALYAPTVTFSNEEAGQKLNVAPTYTISPTPEEIGNGCTGYNVTVTFDCEEAGITGAAAPEANGKGWTMTVKIAYDRHYNMEATATSKWFYYEIPTSKVEPTITVSSFEKGATLNKNTLPTVTVTEGLSYAVTYNCEDAGITGATTPTANGMGWNMTVTVTGNDLYKDATLTVGWFRYEEIIEKVDAVVTFSNGDTAGLPFDLNNLPTATVSEGAEYTITYNCEEAGISGASAVSFTGKGWNMVVTVKENDQYNAGTFTSKWFRALYAPTVTFSNEEAGQKLNAAPTYTISPTPEEIGNGCTGYAVTVTFDCEEAGIAGAAAPEANGKGWTMTVKIAYDRHYNMEATAVSKWFFYEKASEKIEPTITVSSFEKGATLNKNTLPTVTVTEGLSYTITYDCEEAGIADASAPEANGKGWTMTVTVKGNDLYNDAKLTSKWFFYEQPIEKAEPTITVSSFEKGATLNKNTLPTVTVTEGLSYAVTYNCEDAGITGATTPVANGMGWNMTITVTGNDSYKDAALTVGWFRYEEITEKVDAVVTFANESTGLPFDVTTPPTFTISEGAKYKVVYICGDAGITVEDNYTAPIVNGKGWQAVVIVEGDDQYNAGTFKSLWFRAVYTPVVTFSNEEAGQKLNVAPVYTISPTPEEIGNGCTGYNVTVTFDCEEAGITNATAPEANGKGWTMTVKIAYDRHYNMEATATSKWFFYEKPSEKIEPTITVSSFDKGSTLNKNTLPTVTVTEGLSYTVTYNCEDAGITGATTPVANGYGWSMTVTVKGNDSYKDAALTVGWFRYEEVVEQAEATVVFSNGDTAGLPFDIKNLPTVTVSEGAEYTITYDCGDAGITGASAVTFNGKGWCMVVTVKESAKFKAGTYTSKWFRALYNPIITFSNLEAGAKLDAVPTYTISPTPEEIGNGCTGYTTTVTFDCEGAGITGASAPQNNGYGWTMTVKIAYDRHYNLEATATSKWFYYTLSEESMVGNVKSLDGFTTPTTVWGSNNNGVNGEYVSLKDGIVTFKIDETNTTGAALKSVNKYGSGSFSITAKSSGVSGICFALWTYYYADGGNVNNEIDIEFYGDGDNNAKVIYSSWTGLKVATNERSTLNYSINDGKFHTYRFDWYTAQTAANTADSKPRVEYYIDDVKVCTIYNTDEKTVVPTEEMTLWIGAWCPTWAGENVKGTYYMYVSDISYTEFTK